MQDVTGGATAVGPDIARRRSHTVHALHAMQCGISRSAVFALHAWAAGEVCEGCQCTHANHTELLAIGDLGAGAVSLAMGPALHVVNTVPRHKDCALSKRQK